MLLAIRPPVFAPRPLIRSSYWRTPAQAVGFDASPAGVVVLVRVLLTGPVHAGVCMRRRRGTPAECSTYSSEGVGWKVSCRVSVTMARPSGPRADALRPAAACIETFRYISNGIRTVRCPGDALNEACAVRRQASTVSSASSNITSRARERTARVRIDSRSLFLWEIAWSGAAVPALFTVLAVVPLVTRPSSPCYKRVHKSVIPVRQRQRSSPTGVDIVHGRRRCTLSPLVTV